MNPESGPLAEGYLEKAGKNQWKLRYFVLGDNFLKYYDSYEARHAPNEALVKGRLSVTPQLRIAFCPQGSHGSGFTFPIIQLVTSNHRWILRSPPGYGRYILYQWYEKLLMSFRFISDVRRVDEGD